MERRALDRILSAGGLVVSAVLLVAGGLLRWAHIYVHGQVHDQLAAQQIFFPPSDSLELVDERVGPYLNQYAGQQLRTGEQARAYAEHFIAVHVHDMTGGKTYAQLSEQAHADPSNTKLSGLVDATFRGETLRGLLLNAFAFDTMGRLARIGSLVSLSGSGAMAVLSVLGLRHARRQQ